MVLGPFVLLPLSYVIRAQLHNLLEYALSACVQCLGRLHDEMLTV